MRHWRRGILPPGGIPGRPEADVEVPLREGDRLGHLASAGRPRRRRAAGVQRQEVPEGGRRRQGVGPVRHLLQQRPRQLL